MLMTDGRCSRRRAHRIAKLTPTQATGISYLEYPFPAHVSASDLELALRAGASQMGGLSRAARVLSIPEDDLIYVALDGRLDLEGTGEIDLQFTARTLAQRKPVVVDLAGVSFLASIGMRMLM